MSSGKVHHYYRCPKRVKHGAAGCENARNGRAAELEGLVWDEVATLLRDPEWLRAGLSAMIEAKRKRLRNGGANGDARAWHAELGTLVRKRAAFQDQQAAGLMTLDELRSRLAELEDARQGAERELSKLRATQEEIDAIEADAQALVALGVDRLVVVLVYDEALARRGAELVPVLFRLPLYLLLLAEACLAPPTLTPHRPSSLECHICANYCIIRVKCWLTKPKGRSMLTDMKIDGVKVRAARERAFLSRTELADAAGLSRATVGRIEGGSATEVYPRTIRRIARALSVDPASLTPGD